MASRLSDGTLRYLCLLAILCDPDPPSLICIEEPELGLHPDMLPKIADLLVAASERTQLIVTTHSDMLVGAMTEQPESVVVMEKHDGKTQVKRLEANDELQEYLKSYRLGELWLRGLVGGTRPLGKTQRRQRHTSADDDDVHGVVDCVGQAGAAQALWGKSAGERLTRLALDGIVRPARGSRWARACHP